MADPALQAEAALATLLADDRAVTGDDRRKLEAALSVVRRLSDRW